MTKKTIATILGLAFACSLAWAQGAPSADSGHRSYDQRARACKQQAADQQLSGDEARAFIARCMKQ